MQTKMLQTKLSFAVIKSSVLQTKSETKKQMNKCIAEI